MEKFGNIYPSGKFMIIQYSMCTTFIQTYREKTQIRCKIEPLRMEVLNINKKIERVSFTWQWFSSRSTNDITFQGIPSPEWLILSHVRNSTHGLNTPNMFWLVMFMNVRQFAMLYFLTNSILKDASCFSASVCQFQ